MLKALWVQLLLNWIWFGFLAIFNFIIFESFSYFAHDSKCGCTDFKNTEVSDTYVVITVGVDEEKACNKHALPLQEIWRKYLLSCLHMLLESMAVQKILVI